MSEAKKVYVVTDGDYSDYHICAVFDSEQAAQDYIAMRGRLDASFGGSVEPWILSGLWAVHSPTKKPRYGVNYSTLRGEQSRNARRRPNHDLRVSHLLLCA